MGPPLYGRAFQTIFQAVGNMVARFQPKPLIETAESIGIGIEGAVGQRFPRFSHDHGGFFGSVRSVRTGVQRWLVTHFSGLMTVGSDSCGGARLCLLWVRSEVF
ncbi:hypothetical protein D9M70_489670 [compost metagenome]